LRTSAVQHGRTIVDLLRNALFGVQIKQSHQANVAAFVTEAAGKLQAARLIRYQRGKITVLDRPGVEARACECYQVVKTEFDRLLPYALR
jgi:hypothetical protein